MEKPLDDLTPQQVESRAVATYRAHDYQRAIQTFRLAEQKYRAQGEPLKAAEMANNRCVVYLQLDESASALEALEGIIEIFRNAGDKKRLAMAWGIVPVPWKRRVSWKER